ncbi:MAG TPA: AlkA N-terminal domain-containing protein [Chloroflexota bacterium]|nr:AlkA N-terminal domain-containing protein [Chloroflexota bacterium]
MELDFDTCYRALQSRDARFDGQFFTAVTSTGIYCRPICPAQTPKRENVRFYRSAAAAVAAGFRACRRCRPDAAPQSADWNIRADLTGRALRLIAEGAVDGGRVSGLAGRLSVSPRHLHRELVAEVGCGPLALARVRRTQTARLLIDQTAMSLSEIAFTAGFGSIRQFNDSMRAAFVCNPSELRRKPETIPAGAGGITLRLEYRAPFDGAAVLAYLSRRAIPSVEEAIDGRYRRTIALGRSAGTIELEPVDGAVRLRLSVEDLRDLAPAVQRGRDLLDLDADPRAIASVLGADPLLAPTVAARPGLRIPGNVDGWEMAARAVVGQQISIEAARTLVGRLARDLGESLPQRDGRLERLFPRPEAVADADLSRLGLTRARAETLRRLASTVATGGVALDRGADREETRARLLAIPGIGPWTASYIAMRALGDPDAFLESDLAVRRAAERLGLDPTPRSLLAYAERWRPWRAYAVLYLWETLATAGSLQPARKEAS